MEQGIYQFKSKSEIIDYAIGLIDSKANCPDSESFSDPGFVVNFLKINHKQHPYETFSVCFLSGSLNLISHELVSIGSVNQSYVYPRVIAQKALELNASKIIICHHHPQSCWAIPSDEDISFTKRLSNGLSIIDVEVVDHIILSGSDAYSFSENKDI